MITSIMSPSSAALVASRSGAGAGAIRMGITALIPTVTTATTGAVTTAAVTTVAATTAAPVMDTGILAPITVVKAITMATSATGTGLPASITVVTGIDSYCGCDSCVYSKNRSSDFQSRLPRADSPHWTKVRWVQRANCEN